MKKKPPACVVVKPRFSSASSSAWMDCRVISTRLGFRDQPQDQPVWLSSDSKIWGVIERIWKGYTGRALFVKEWIKELPFVVALTDNNLLNS